MLFTPSSSSQLWTYDNWTTTPASTIGTSVTPGTANGTGSYAIVATGANLAQDTYGFHLVVHSGASSGGVKNQLLDIGVDPAGGTSYTDIISNLDIGSSPAVTAATGGKEFYFPYFIKSGSQVAARVRGWNATAGTVRVAAKFYGYPSAPEGFPVGCYSQTFGATTAESRGTNITPGSSAWSSYTDLGAVTNPLWWWQMGHGITNTTITAEYAYIQLAYGDTTNKHTIMTMMHVGTTGETVGIATNSNLIWQNAYCKVPAGANIYIRAYCNGAPDTGYHVNVVGIGG